jgi:hypothetical protein
VTAEFGTRQAYPERLVEARMEEAPHRRLEETLDRALGALSSEERVFKRTHFEDGSRANETARAFHVPQKALSPLSENPPPPSPGSGRARYRFRIPHLVP